MWCKRLRNNSTVLVSMRLCVGAFCSYDKLPQRTTINRIQALRIMQESIRLKKHVSNISINYSSVKWKREVDETDGQREDRSMMDLWREKHRHHVLFFLENACEIKKKLGKRALCDVISLSKSLLKSQFYDYPFGSVRWKGNKETLKEINGKYKIEKFC